MGRLSPLASSCRPRLAGRTLPDRTDIDNKQNIDRMDERSVRSLLIGNGGCDLSERLINRLLALGRRQVGACRWAEMPGAGPMIPICEDQEPEGARACP